MREGCGKADICSTHMMTSSTSTPNQRFERSRAPGAGPHNDSEVRRVLHAAHGVLHGMNPGSLACFWRGSDKKKYEFIKNKDREFLEHVS